MISASYLFCPVNQVARYMALVKKSLSCDQAMINTGLFSSHSALASRLFVFKSTS